MVLKSSVFGNLQYSQDWLLELTSQSSNCFAQSPITFASVSVNGDPAWVRPSRSFEEMKDQIVGSPRPVKWLRPTCIISVSLLNGSSAKLCSCRSDGKGALIGINGQDKWSEECSRSIIWLYLVTKKPNSRYGEIPEGLRELSPFAWWFINPYRTMIQN